MFGLAPGVTVSRGETFPGSSPQDAALERSRFGHLEPGSAPH